MPAPRSKSHNAQFAAGIVMLLVQVAFAGWHVLGKMALNQGISPLFFALVREGGASVVLLVSALIFDGRPKLPTRREIFIFIILGFLIFINIVGFILALNLVSPVTAAIYQPMIPVWTALFAVIFKMEPANPMVLFGVLLSVTGAVIASMSDEGEGTPSSGGDGSNRTLLSDEAPLLLSSFNASDTLNLRESALILATQHLSAVSHYTLLGHMILLVQTFSLGILYLVQKQIVHEFPALTSTAWYYSIGSSFTAITCLFYFQSYKDIMEQGHYLHNTSVQIGVLYAIFVATAFTYGGSTWANRQTHATIVSLYTVLQSPFTLILSVCFLGTVPRIRDIVCMLLIIVGMALVVGSKLKEEKKGQIESGSHGSHTIRVDYHPVQEEDKRNM
eukprot:CAMPEP_0198241816 /NCGR_PEP_ID=MMETSP1446-20131203/6510_1 /TAXON_ID=1461542 ORGANISM="Unidentified sp, Strain CCMP2111" /NCGR_SAMPLE_ID=MMETSP1446 /ASSEMBLY_ACC=CAM_ASM_001112 /LENGTH=388 /DNA_ID=CAMNT_0043924693 /DNA_START=429 /DNA_END=1595 /DNA_ORIENTATION=-